jgi:hypothetical protein
MFPQEMGNYKKEVSYTGCPKIGVLTTYYRIEDV